MRDLKMSMTSGMVVILLSVTAQAIAEPPLSADQLTAEASALAKSGRLDELINVLKAAPAGQLGDPELAALREQIDHHESIEAQRRTRTRQAFEKRMAEMAEHREAGDLTKAMAKAVEAHDLADDRDAFLLREDVLGLVRQAENKAKDYQAKQEWLEALSLYRRLDLLYEMQRRYKGHVRRIAQRLRLLRTYAPDAWFEQSAAYAEAHGDPPPERWSGDEQQNWEKDLEKVDSAMLRRALVLAARQHVEAARFEQLLRGGLDGLFDFLETAGLDQSFPSLNDTAKVNAFATELMRLKARIDSRTVDMAYPDASAIVRDVLQANRDTLDLPEAVVVYEFGEGAVATLDDFSSNIWPAQKARFERTTKGEFTGVGIQITLTDGELTVVSPLEDTPAHRAHIQAGDRIVTVDGRPTTGISLDQAVEEITGPEGTKVTLGIRSPGADLDRNVTLTRARIKLTSTKGWRREAGGGWDYYIDPALRLGYVRVTQFGPDTADALDKAVQQMRQDKGINGLILDLRFNPGGLLTAATAMGDRFLADGVIVSGQAQAGATAWQARAYEHHTYPHFPVVVLINRGSASASEIVAGALQDRHRAIILGERSYGKGSVQQVLWHSDEQAALKLTTQYYVLPSGRIIHRRPGVDHWGIDPDITVRMTDQEVEQLLKARMLLDVLRDAEGQDVDPEALIGHGDDEDDEAEEEPLPPIRDASDILTLGLDPQLETALILLKAQAIDDPRG